MRFNVSEVIDFDNCPTLHRNRWVRENRTENSSFALELGTAVHKVLKQIVLGESVENVEDLIGPAAIPKDRNSAKSADLVLAQWKSIPRDWEVIAAEELMEMEVTDPDGGSFVLYGTPDLVVRWSGKTWHVQHKTLSASRPLWSYVKEIKSSLHEGLYGEMIDRTYGNYAGTMLNVVRKISLKQATLDPSTGMHMEFMKISKSLRTEVLADLTMRKRDLENAYRDKDRPYKRRKHCLGTHGNQACYLYEACHGAGTGRVGETSSYIDWASQAPPAPIDDLAHPGRIFVEGQDFSGGPGKWDVG